MVEEKPGYQDTPFLPGNKYRVHDKARPHPRVVVPGTFGTQEKPGCPPSDAIILFDGKDLSNWLDNNNEPAKWKVENGYMEVVPGAGDIHTRQEFGDCQLHLEWMEPTVIKGESQGRGNSGVFLMGRYEIQVLDCYQNPTYADGWTGAIYGQWPPLVSACRKPGEWQTYDIIWIAPRFDGEKVISPARITVLMNGIVIHHNRELFGPTTHRQILPYSPHASVGPLKLQDHGDLVRYRNIWYRVLTDYDAG
ncbi:MAG: DUF1080 domain-containing protein [Candidatus Omnitrophica bacterium]|nr:DUF1080 domain-containing protein [Candidatus Omnitrophota bacterium]